MKKFFYTYVLFSNVDKKLYIGWTPDLKSRLKEHNDGNVLSTKSRRPLDLILYESFVSKKDSLFREKFLKSGWGRRHLKSTLKNTLEEYKA